MSATCLDDRIRSQCAKFLAAHRDGGCAVDEKAAWHGRVDSRPTRAHFLSLENAVCEDSCGRMWQQQRQSHVYL